MNSRLLIVIAVALAATDIAPQASATEPACAGMVVVRSEVAIAAEELLLSDLLEPGACPRLLWAARQIVLGNAPLAGSVRVLVADQIRAFSQKLEAVTPSASWNVPQRITVRRAGNRDSCADLGQQILSSLPSRFVGPARVSAIDCSAAGRISRGAPLILSRAAWNSALASWEIAARCEHPADCAPFLVRVRGSERGPEPGRPPSPETAVESFSSRPSPSPESGASRLAGERPLVRPGQTANLVWDQDGIRLLVPVVCLDRGALGQAVRARILPGGRVIRAIVVSAEELRAVS